MALPAGAVGAVGAVGVVGVLEREVGRGEGGCLCGVGSDWKTFSHQKSFHGSLLFEPLPPHHPPWKPIFAVPNLIAHSLHFKQQPYQTSPPNVMNAD